MHDQHDDKLQPAKDAHEAHCLCGDGGPALFKTAVLNWAERRDAMFNLIGANKTTLSELMKKGQLARLELFKYLAQPFFVKCNQAVMAKQNLASLKGDGQAGSAKECMAVLAIKIEAHGKDLEASVQALKKIIEPLVDGEERKRVNSLIDEMVKENNDNAAKFVGDQMDVDYGAQAKAEDGYQPTEADMKSIESFGIQFHSKPIKQFTWRDSPTETERKHHQTLLKAEEKVDALRAKLGNWFPMKQLIAVLNGSMSIKDFPTVYFIITCLLFGHCSPYNDLFHGRTGSPLATS